MENFRIKDKIYSDVENKYISVMDIEKIIVEDAIDCDLGYFKVTAFVCDNGEGWRVFPGKIEDLEWSSEGLANLAEARNNEAKRCGKTEKCGAVTIDYLFVKPDATKSESDMWREMWTNTNNRVNKFAKDIKEAQNLFRTHRTLTTINLHSY